MGIIFQIQELGFSFQYFLDMAYIHQKLFPGMINLSEYRDLEWDEWIYHQQKLVEEANRQKNGERQ